MQIAAGMRLSTLLKRRFVLPLFNDVDPATLLDIERMQQPLTSLNSFLGGTPSNTTTLKRRDSACVRESNIVSAVYSPIIARNRETDDALRKLKGTHLAKLSCHTRPNHQFTVNRNGEYSTLVCHIVHAHLYIIS
jgi:hypothetical protein